MKNVLLFNILRCFCQRITREVETVQSCSPGPLAPFWTWRILTHDYTVDVEVTLSLPAQQSVRPGSKGAMGSFASLAFGAFGNKTASFWSVLGTPKMRRGKSMETVAQNRINIEDTGVNQQKRHSKGKLLGFLGSSADYIRGKMRSGHNRSIDSDPGFQKAGPPLNGHICKRLVRGETIDTLSTDSIDDITDRQCSTDEYHKQETLDSSVFEGEESMSTSPIKEQVSMQMMRTQSDIVTARPPLCHASRLRDTMDAGDNIHGTPSRRASIGAMDSLTVNYHAVLMRPRCDTGSTNSKLNARFHWPRGVTLFQGGTPVGLHFFKW